MAAFARSWQEMTDRCGAICPKSKLSDEQNLSCGHERTCRPVPVLPRANEARLHHSRRWLVRPPRRCGADGVSLG